MSRDKKPEHLGFELSEGEGFNRDRVSVFLLLNLVVQSYAEHQIAGFGGKSKDLGLAAFMRELTGLFQGRYPDVLKGYGEEEGWSGKPFTAWLRARLADSLTEQGSGLLRLERRCISRAFCSEQDDRRVARPVCRAVAGRQRNERRPVARRNDSHLLRPLVADFER